MQCIILAAGSSTRLRPLTNTTPKCLLDIRGKNLLHRTIENVTSNGVSEFIFVTGYRENMIKDYVVKNFPKISARFIVNTDYENNNNSYSLWMTKEFVSDDVILLDSDILFDRQIITGLIESEYENCLALNSKIIPDAEQIKTVLDDAKKVLQIGKYIPIEHSQGESIGIERLSSYFMKGLFAILDRKILRESKVNEFYEASFEELINSGDARNSLYAVDVSELACIEIDTVSDYENAQKILVNNE